MNVRGNDLSLMIDMAQCALDIADITAGIGYGEFAKDRTRRLAVERQLGIMGQAAGKINRKTRGGIESIPWVSVMRLKGKMAHGHGEVLAERIWALSQGPVARLLRDLETVEGVREYLRDKRRRAK
jgi:uncharacterized protein with HEPN domain